MQTTTNLPPAAQPSRVTITTVGPNGRTQTISGPEVIAVPQAPMAPGIIVARQPSPMTAKLISMGLAGTFMVLLPMSIAMAIRMIRRPVRVQNQITPAVDERLLRLEQSIDAIAIEMERVSEGQRYVTKLLASDKVTN